MTHILLLKNCTLADGNNCQIGITGQHISYIGEDIPKAYKVMDCEGKIVFPGIIDVHTHIRDMGLAYKEDWLSASQAAAVGGVTTLFDMPNTKPATFDAISLTAKREAAQKSIVNYGYNFGVTEFNHKSIENAKPIAALKMFMAESSSGYVVENKSVISEIFHLAKEINKPVIVHSELQSCVEKFEKLYPLNITNHNKIRNRECAIKASQILIELAAKTGANIYIAHVSTAEEIDLIRAAKKSGINNLFCEITPHHLFINETVLKECGNFGKVNPPLRTLADNESLRQAIIDGTADAIGSDHAPHSLEEKNRNYQSAPSGFPGLETSLGLLLQLVHSGEINWARLEELMCTNPANIFRISKRGRLKPGAYADLIIIDPNESWQVDAVNFYTKAKYSPFDGMKLKGKVKTTIVNGNIVFQNDKINDIKGQEVEFE